MRKFVADEAQKLKDFTDAHYPQGSFAFSRLLRDRDIRVNGEKTGKNIDLSPGDEVCYYTTAKEESRPFYSIVYEDECLLVVVKPTPADVKSKPVKAFGQAHHPFDLDVRYKQPQQRGGKKIKIIIGSAAKVQVIESVGGLLPFAFDNLPQESEDVKNKKG